MSLSAVTKSVASSHTLPTGSIASTLRLSSLDRVWGESAIDIANWLQQIGLAQHAELFRAEKIDAAVLPTLTAADLRELGLPLGDRKKLRAAIDALGTTDSAGAVAVSAPPRAAAEQRHLTVMFCDIIDSTRLAATLDLEILQTVTDGYQRQVAGCVARYD